MWDFLFYTLFTHLIIPNYLYNNLNKSHRTIRDKDLAIWPPKRVNQGEFMQEEWKSINCAPGYYVSSRGRVQKSDGTEIRVGHVTDGSLSAVLSVNRASRPYLIRRLVAEAFCGKLAVTHDTVIHLDGQKDNCDVENLAWRPRWFAWKYSRQFNEPVRSRWMYPIRVVQTGEEFGSLIEAGMHFGMLWEDIQLSAIEGKVTYPHGYIFEWV